MTARTLSAAERAAAAGLVGLELRPRLGRLALGQKIDRRDIAPVAVVVDLRRPDADTLIGAADPGGLRGPGAIDGVTTGDDFDAAWRSLETERREASGWAPALAD